MKHRLKTFFQNMPDPIARELWNLLDSDPRTSEKIMFLLVNSHPALEQELISGNFPKKELKE